MAAANTGNLHEQLIVIDGTCPLLRRKELVSLYIEGGVTACAPTVGGSFGATETFRNLGSWHRLIQTNPSLMLVRKASDIEVAKREKKIGLVFHFQGTEPIETDLNLVEAYREVGVRMVQLSYNVKNRVGDGCEERTDCGLSRFGVDLIRRLNENRIIVDCAHTGYRTTMDAIELSRAPVVFSHANPRAVHGSPRNIRDDQIKAIAATGGLIGINGFPAFVSGSNKPSMDEFINHIDYAVELVGIDHVGLGIDYFEFMHPIASDEDAMRMYKASLDIGRWSTASYPPPPYYYPDGMGTPCELPNLTARLVERGYKAEDVGKIMGGNWLRVFRAVWGE